MLKIYLFCAMALALNAQTPAQHIGMFHSVTDIGNPNIPGSVSYHEPSQIYRLSGSGENIWFDKDSFTFLHKNMQGDFIIQANIKFEGQGHDPHRKTGLMIRHSKASDAPMLACTVHGDGLTSLQYRKNKGANVEELKFNTQEADVLQLEKIGTTYIVSVARFGAKYEVAQITDIDLGSNPLAGLFVCAHTNEFSEEVIFNNVRVFNTATDELVPYEDYLGSLLEIMDVENGDRRILDSYTGSWQAPNWTPDGKTLIYNAEGKLYNFELQTHTSTVLNTDFADRNNNDHVLTFDGKQIGISHHAEEANGQSIIYTLPVSGGVPKKITEKGPSYLHGWSPDNKYLVYTAQRNEVYNIYRIPAAGGKEIQLTHTQGLDDGPEYSPDGKYIYFNSTRTGTMQLWRMDADGKNQVQLTFDALNDWFPHISPNNKWIVFISFPEDVPADQHPFYKRVYIRLMPIEGGEPKVIGYLYGGQGTINVPSWSPDSTKIAFVSNGTF
ncbi:biopolymer transporter TolR [Arenibacter sp. GZD96]|uniref:TolB family protein n=1 Tax=Aurantibrevibacter litoralis TaxID=3106030 RepID=UPI002AFFF889|nr:hypothetical protein [Arenibacter sp. GZD-96]MEA1786162.1 biopolymer transporter TolR [Arenibacter sp. GZD-96]